MEDMHCPQTEPEKFSFFDESFPQDQITLARFEDGNSPDVRHAGVRQRLEQALILAQKHGACPHRFRHVMDRQHLDVEVYFCVVQVTVKADDFKGPPSSSAEFSA